ncbi:6248_t:CDS:2, partial [Scutellospora calospora]
MIKNSPEISKFFDLSNKSSDTAKFILKNFILLPKHFNSSEQEFLLDQTSKKKIEKSFCLDLSKTGGIKPHVDNVE